MAITTSQRTYFKHNWMTFANLLLLLGLVYNYATSQQKMRDDIKELNKHSGDKILHLPFDKKIQIFVPRIELDSRLESIEEHQREASVKQDAIYKLLLQLDR